MDSSQEKDKTATDPFAGDIFADARTAKSNEIEEKSPSQASEKPLWSHILRKARVSKTNWNNLHKNLPADFVDNLPRRMAESFARLINFINPADGEILFINEREINQQDEIPPSNPDSWWLTIGIENGLGEFFLEIGNVFAVWLVDSLINEEAAVSPQIRRLTPSEAAVIEFAALQLTHEANQTLQSPIFAFRSLNHQIPATLADKFKSETPSLLITDWQITYEKQTSLVKIYVLPESLTALQPDENRLLNSSLRQTNWARYKTRAENLKMRINCGIAELNVGELAALGKGDIVLLQKTPFSINRSNFSGRLEIFLGDDVNTIISGNVASEVYRTENSAEKSLQDDTRKVVKPLNFDIFRQVSITGIDQSERPQSFEKNMLEENENTNEPNEEMEQAPEKGLKLENIGVTLRVELEARHLTLEEAAGLKINQVLDLGVSPTDSVNLLLNDKIVGRGELVEIENRLGVRIVNLLQ